MQEPAGGRCSGSDGWTDSEQQHRPL